MLSTVFYALGVWLLASVPSTLLLGWMCSLNQLSQDGGEGLPSGSAPAPGRTTPDPAPTSTNLATA